VTSLRCALDDITIELRSGHFVAIMGLSGSGKTTLLNLMQELTTRPRVA